MPKKLAISAEFSATDEISSTLKKIEKSIQAFSNKSSRSLSKVNKSTWSIVKGFAGFQVAKSGLGAIKNIFSDMAGTIVRETTSIIDIGAKYEKALDKVAAKMGGIKKGSEAYKSLGKIAEKVGMDTEFSASQSAQGLEYLAMAGFKAKQAIAALPKLVDVATVADIDFARSTDIISDTMGAFGLSTKNTTQLLINMNRVSDVMAKTITSSNTTLEALFESFKHAGPAGSKFGASLETISAMLGELANSGLKGEAAGNALKNVFLRLASPASAGRKALRGIGVTIADKEGKLRKISDIFGDLSTKLNKLTEIKRIEVLNKIFGARAITAVSLLLDSGTEKINKFREQLERSTGTASRMATQIRGNLSGSMASLRSKIEGLKLKFFTALAPILNKIVPHLIKAAESAAKWVEQNEQFVSSTILSTLQMMWTVLKGIWRVIKMIASASGMLPYFKLLLKANNLLQKQKETLEKNRSIIRETLSDVTDKANIQVANKALIDLQTQLIQTKNITKSEKIIHRKNTVDINIQAPSGTTIKKGGPAKDIGKFNLKTGRVEVIGNI